MQLQSRTCNSEQEEENDLPNEKPQIGCTAVIEARLQLLECKEDDPQYHYRHNLQRA